VHAICQFVQFIFEKIIKIVANRYHLLKLKCTKFDFGWGSASDLAGGTHSAPPDTLAGFKGVLLLREKRKKEGKSKKTKKKEKKGKGKEGKGRGKERG